MVYDAPSHVSPGRLALARPAKAGARGTENSKRPGGKWWGSVREETQEGKHSEPKGSPRLDQNFVSAFTTTMNQGFKNSTSCLLPSDQEDSYSDYRACGGVKQVQSGYYSTHSLVYRRMRSAFFHHPSSSTDGLEFIGSDKTISRPNATLHRHLLGTTALAQIRDIVRLEPAIADDVAVHIVGQMRFLLANAVVVKHHVVQPTLGVAAHGILSVGSNTVRRGLGRVETDALTGADILQVAAHQNGAAFRHGGKHRRGLGWVRRRRHRRTRGRCHGRRDAGTAAG
jgi:hypothetical protein